MVNFGGDGVMAVIAYLWIQICPLLGNSLPATAFVMATTTCCLVCVAQSIMLACLVCII